MYDHSQGELRNEILSLRLTNYDDSLERDISVRNYDALDVFQEAVGILLGEDPRNHWCNCADEEEENQCYKTHPLDFGGESFQRRYLRLCRINTSVNRRCKAVGGLTNRFVLWRTATQDQSLL